MKLFDYAAYGRPLLVTDCTEQAAVVADADAGVIVSDNERAMADGVLRMIGADAAQIDRWSEQPRRAALASFWSARAGTILARLDNHR